MKCIIRRDDSDPNWPRQYVQQCIRERGQQNQGVIRPKIIKFADEAAFSPDPNVFEAQKVNIDFVLRQIEEFFQTRRSIVLVDLLAIDSSNQPREISLNAASQGGRYAEPELAKSQYLETDPNYVPPPSSLDPESQK